MAKVTIYTTPTCPYCKQEKEFLKENNVEFEEIDVASDSDKAKEMVDKTGQMGVPATIVKTDDEKEEIIIGFNQDKLKELLDL